MLGTILIVGALLFLPIAVLGRWRNIWDRSRSAVDRRCLNQVMQTHFVAIDAQGVLSMANTMPTGSRRCPLPSTKTPRPAARASGIRCSRRNWLAALKQSFVMLRPDIQWKNPVMFVVEVGAFLTLLFSLRQLGAPRESGGDCISSRSTSGSF